MRLLLSTILWCLTRPFVAAGDEIAEFIRLRTVMP